MNPGCPPHRPGPGSSPFPSGVASCHETYHETYAQRVQTPAKSCQADTVLTTQRIPYISRSHSLAPSLPHSLTRSLASRSLRGLKQFRRGGHEIRTTIPDRGANPTCFRVQLHSRIKLRLRFPGVRTIRTTLPDRSTIRKISAEGLGMQYGISFSSSLVRWTERTSGRTHWPIICRNTYFRRLRLGSVSPGETAPALTFRCEVRTGHTGVNRTSRRGYWHLALGIWNGILHRFLGSAGPRWTRSQAWIPGPKHV